MAFFAYEYMQHEGREERFFGFYTMTLGILMGLGLAGNLLTLYMFYEMIETTQDKRSFVGEFLTDFQEILSELSC